MREIKVNERKMKGVVIKREHIRLRGDQCVATIVTHLTNSTCRGPTDQNARAFYL